MARSLLIVAVALAALAALAGAERESMSLATEAELLNEVRNAGRGLAWAI